MAEQVLCAQTQSSKSDAACLPHWLPGFSDNMQLKHQKFTSLFFSFDIIY
jgi:hypothetical protein